MAVQRIWTNFKLTQWTDERDIYWLGGCDLFMSPSPGNLSKTCTAEGWTEMHPIDIALNCGYNLNSTSDDVSKPPQSIRSIRTNTHCSCESTPQWETISRANGQEELNENIFSFFCGWVLLGSGWKMAVNVVFMTHVFTSHLCYVFIR